MKLFMYLLLVIPLGLSAQQNSIEKGNDAFFYKISGTISGPARDSIDKIFLFHSMDGKIIDTSLVRNGSFEFSGYAERVQSALLKMNNKLLNKEDSFRRTYLDYRNLFIGEGPLLVNISTTMKLATIKGSPLTSAQDTYDAYLQKGLSAIQAIQEQRSSMEKEERFRKLAVANDQLDQMKKKFILSHSDNVFALTALKDLIDRYNKEQALTAQSDSLYKDLVESYNALVMPLKNSSEGMFLKARIDEVKTNKLPDFSGPDLSGGRIDISDYKGRVFLIDFWGSWCVWCRTGHPHLKELYNKYKPKGFEIIAIGVELDKDRKIGEEKLRNAILKDGITWPQLFNENDGTNDLTKIFSVSTYPTKILVDREGNIVLRVGDDMEGKLDAKLEELFKDKN